MCQLKSQGMAFETAYIRRHAKDFKSEMFSAQNAN